MVCFHFNPRITDAVVSSWAGWAGFDVAGRLGIADLSSEQESRTVLYNFK